MTEIFVFGSNLHGLHYGGSAKYALDVRGAIMGKGIGIQGNSYAIPTLSGDFEKLSLEIIKLYVRDFLNFARRYPRTTFNIVAIGCGIAGFTPREIAPLFAKATNNCILPIEFKEVLR